MTEPEYKNAHTRLTNYMRSRGLKLTRQRELILRTFLTGRRHIAVDDLLRQARQDDPRVGHATVYRTMKLFVDAGIAHERNFSDGAAQYEPAAPNQHEHHDHLICTSCGRIVEFENEEIELLQEIVATRHGFTLTDHRMELYGVCKGMAGKGVCSMAPPD